jgi:hypothetical protein
MKRLVIGGRNDQPRPRDQVPGRKTRRIKRTSFIRRNPGANRGDTTVTRAPASQIFWFYAKRGDRLPPPGILFQKGLETRGKIPSLNPKKVLLTSVCRPFGTEYGDADSVGYELLHKQVTRAQGIFSPRAVQVQYSLEYIAANLETPTVVLQYPSRSELIRELKKGLRLRGRVFHHGAVPQNERRRRPDSQIFPPQQNHFRRVRHGSFGRGFGSLRRLFLPGRRGDLFPTASGRNANSKTLQTSLDCQRP